MLLLPPRGLERPPVSPRGFVGAGGPGGLRAWGILGHSGAGRGLPEGVSPPPPFFFFLVAHVFREKPERCLAS